MTSHAATQSAESFVSWLCGMGHCSLDLDMFGPEFETRPAVLLSAKFSTEINEKSKGDKQKTWKT